VKKRKQAETGEDDPEEGEPRTKAEKAAAAKVKKDLAKAKAKAKAKAEAESKKALDKAKKKFLVDTKAKAKAKATGKPRPKPASRAKRQKTASKDGEGTAAPSNTEGDDTPASMDEEPAPAVDAQKKTFAGRCRPSKQTPAARFDALRKVFNTHVKGKVQQASTMEAPGFYGLLQHTPLPLTICCTMGTYGLIKSIFIHQKLDQYGLGVDSWTALARQLKFWNFCVAKQREADSPPDDLPVFFEGCVAPFFEQDSIKGYLA
jgi:hypothetical protein